MSTPLITEIVLQSQPDGLPVEHQLICESGIAAPRRKIASTLD
jgi:hypothetical protein